MPKEEFTPKPRSAAEAPKFQEISPELLALVGGESPEVIEIAIAILKQEIKDAPVVGRSLAAIRGKELVIPITTATQKAHVLEALLALNIFPWEEDGVIVIDHHLDMQKLSLAGVTDESLPQNPALVLPENSPEVTFPLTRFDSLSEHIKTQNEARKNLPNDVRGTPPSQPNMPKVKTEGEVDSDTEPDIDVELKRLIDRFDQGLIDETDAEFQKSVGVFPTLTLFPRQYVWQKRQPREIRTGRVIDKEERNELYVLAKEGDRDAITKLTRMHVGLVIEAVVRMKEKFGGDPDDLFQEGMMGLVHSMENYDVQGAASFGTYAMYGIESRMQRYQYRYRHQINRPDHLRAQQRAYQKVAKTEEITAAELPTAAQEVLSKGEYVGGMSMGRERLERFYFLNTVFDPIGDEYGDNLIDANGRAEDAYSENMFGGEIFPDIFYRELEEALTPLLLTLTPREERVLRLRFGLSEPNNAIAQQLFERDLDKEHQTSSSDLDGLTLEETGILFDVSKERIRQIEAKALRKLKHPSRSNQIRPFVKLLSADPWRPYDYNKGKSRHELIADLKREIDRLKNTRIEDNNM
jgi:RNA polymerase primary sigma factor